MKKLLLLFLLMLPIPAWAQPAYVSSTSVGYATRTNTTCTAPAGIVNNDILIFLFANNGLADPVTPPAGLTMLSGFPSVYSGTQYWALGWWKRASSESGSYTFTHASGISQLWCGLYRGVIATGSPEDTTGTNSTLVTSTTYTAPGLTTLNANSLILYATVGNTGFSGAVTPPSGSTPTFADRYDVAGPTIVYIAEGVMTAAGATGNKSLTGEANSSNSAHLIALRDDGGTTPVLLDSYADTNISNTLSINATQLGVGQVFQPSISATLTSARFHLSRENSPGTVVARLYATTGTLGSTAIPTGTALATADSFNCTTECSVYPTADWETFTFTGASQYAMTAGVTYAIVLEDCAACSASVTVVTSRDSTSPTHAGNATYKTGVWNAFNTSDEIFEVYGIEITAPAGNAVVPTLYYR